MFAYAALIMLLASGYTHCKIHQKENMHPAYSGSNSSTIRRETSEDALGQAAAPAI